MTETLNVVQGEIEAISKENELQAGPNFCWLKLKNGQTFLANVLQAATLKVGEPIKFTYQESRAGPRITQVLEKKEVEPSGYDGLLNRCRGIVTKAKQSAVEFIKAKWELGKELSSLPQEYGTSTIERLSVDLGLSVSTLRHCIGFALRFPQFDPKKIATAYGFEEDALSWRKVRLPVPTENDTAVPNLPSNPAASPAELVKSFDPRHKPPPTSGGQPELQTFSLLVKELKLKILYQQPVTIPTGKGGHPQSYVLDFCNSARTVDIEIDSDLHDPDDDAERDKNLKKIGIETVRIPGADILTTYKTIKALKKVAEAS